MNRIEFKQRMQKLKSYRDENPGKTYLDFRAYEDGGETERHPKAPYPSFYNGRRVNAWTGQPIATGAVKAAFDLEDAANLTPVGDAITVKDMTEAASHKDWTGLGIAAIGLVPIVGSKGSKVIKNLVRGAERNVANSMKREIPRVNKDLAQREIDNLMKQRERQAQLQKAIEGDDYFIMDPSDAVNARNRVIESIDKRTIDRAKKVDKEFGTNYASAYDKLLSDYQNMNQIDVRMENLTRERAGAKAKLQLDEEYQIGRSNLDPVEDHKKYVVKVNSEEIPTQAHVRHELGHLTDVMQNEGMREVDINNNKLLQELSDPNQLVSYKNFTDLVSDMDPFQYFGYLNKGTEIKSFMNQTRQALVKRGKLKNPNDYVNEKTLAEYMETLADGSGEKTVYKAFKDPKKYNRWFNTIPVVGLAGAAYINRANTNGSDLPSIPDTHL